MRFTYKDPITENEIELTAEPEDYNGEQGFRIIFKKKNQLGPKRLIKSELGSVKLLLVMI